MEKSQRVNSDIEELQKENELLKRILDVINVGICYVDTCQRIVYNNKTQHKIHKCKYLNADGIDLSLGQKVQKIYPSTGHIQAQESQTKGGKEVFYNSGITVRCRYIPVFDEDNRLVGSVGLTRSLEDYRDISIEVKHTKSIFNNFSMIFDNLQEAIVAVDSNGHIVYANDAYSKITGEKTGRLIGHKIRIDSLGEIAHNTLANAKSIHENVVSIGEDNCDVISFPIISEDIILGCFCILNYASTVTMMSEQLERKTQIAEFYRNIVNSKSQLPEAFSSIVGNNLKLIDQLSLAAKAAASDCSVMVLGKNGVGKELVARAIHNASIRSTGPFIAINCAALPDNLLESELFGYDPGAFTGARKEGKPGKFELAHGGTLFLDEIGNMSFYMQAKLLRILQTKENERIGGTKVTKVDVRIISATNKDIGAMIMAGEFREDLYYRLNVVIVNLPDLKDRKSDIPILTDFFIKEFSKQKNIEKVGITDDAMKLLMSYDWPGNVRELRNVIEHSVVFEEDGLIQPYHLPSNLWLHGEEECGEVVIIGKTIPLEDIINSCEKQALIRALEENGGNKTNAMKALNLSRRAFYYKMSKHGLL